MKLKKVVLSLFGIFAFIDIVLTFIAIRVNGTELIESNPLVILLNTKYILIIGNIVTMLVIWWYFKLKRNPLSDYYICVLASWTTFIRIVVSISAIRLIINPLPLEVISNVSTETKITTYSYLVLVNLFIPFIISGVTYWIFTRDYEMVLKNVD